MTLFTNKDQFEDNFEVMELLNRLEKAHKAQDELASAVLLTKLKKLGYIVKAESKEALQ